MQKNTSNILVSFFKLGQNPPMLSEKNWFIRDSCGFPLTLKMKPKFDYLTPPYFCDIGIFHKMAVTLTIIKDKFEKWTRNFIQVLSTSFCFLLYGDTFENFEKKFLFQFCVTQPIIFYRQTDWEIDRYQMYHLVVWNSFFITGIELWILGGNIFSQV